MINTSTYLYISMTVLIASSGMTKAQENFVLTFDSLPSGLINVGSSIIEGDFIITAHQAGFGIHTTGNPHKSLHAGDWGLGHIDGNSLTIRRLDGEPFVFSRFDVAVETKIFMGSIHVDLVGFVDEHQTQIMNYVSSLSTLWSESGTTFSAPVDELRIIIWNSGTLPPLLLDNLTLSPDSVFTGNFDGNHHR